ncbi:T9SS type A sorting domain-containing protein [Fluviicola sp.]|uniref:T9SS type A sorting domain-containing protein n=1 Tax=Fluviicola sp. TaxID=1917219 RepID=UPI0031D94630
MKQIHTFFKHLPLVLVSILAGAQLVAAQCPSGAIGVTGSGCGCMSGCNLTSYGGPNCSPAVTGNCSGGELPMSVNITVPAGCTFTVSAAMQNRAGSCTASGADGGDQLKVDISGGSKSFQTGAGNASISDSYTLTGPGTIVVSGTANRADEIITYTTTSSGATCVSCMSTLPIELTEFQVTLENNAVACDWWTETEINNDYFTIERSIDGIHFEYLASMKGSGNSFNPLHYKIYDYDPYLDVVSYYRLSQTDLDGTTRQHQIKSVKPKKISNLTIFPNPSNGTVQISGDSKTLQASRLFDLSGREIALYTASESTSVTVSSLPTGVYTLVYFDNEKTISERIVVTP